MPRTYRDKRTERFAFGEYVPAFSGIAQQARRRLDRLLVAQSKRDLMSPPSNRFEALRGNRSGQFSIRINDRWRICFEWPDDSPNPFNIEIVDYH